MDSQNDVREFLRSRRAKVTPQQVNLMAGSNPRVPGLRREEVATLASVSGRLAQRRFAADLLDVPASELRGCYDCPRCGTGPGVSHGRPGYSFKEAPVPLLLSLSRAAGWTLLAAVADPAPGLRLGIDVEDSGRLDFDGSTPWPWPLRNGRVLGGCPARRCGADGRASGPGRKPGSR
jgi:hypothetical protein